MQAICDKIWTKEYLHSTNQMELTNIVQHGMCGVTNELLKPGEDPTKILNVAEKLREVALTRVKEGRVKEGQVALKQASLDLSASVTLLSLQKIKG
jgi:hypothetical protein